MNSNERHMNERQAVDELLAQDHFDDSVSDHHRTDLRTKVLQAFDRPSRETGDVELRESAVGNRRLTSRTHRLGFAGIAAVCLAVLAATWFYRGDRAAIRPVVEQPPAADTTADPQLLASLAQVNDFRDEVSREELFDAIAMCELAHEGRMLFDASQP